MGKKSLHRKVFSYTVIFEPAEEGGYCVFVPALPGCFTQGETFEEAQKNAQEVVALYLDVLHEKHEEIPTESGEAIVSRVSVPFPG